ncbi:hypothetical protein ACIGHN_13440 [Acidovorax sp. NPDC077693]|uniref:hypothetical protein n=1 Tax=unclassified Acidovorax TaxID=2684926 RepID=UPI0037C522C6
MARLEHIRQRLENWALWKVRQNDGGLGYHTRSVLAVDVWDAGSYNNNHVPHLELEAERTDEAVGALRLGRGHLHVTLCHYYLDGLGIRETARVMRRGESTIRAQLEQADHAIAVLLSHQAEERERQRMAAEQAERKRSFTP